MNLSSREHQEFLDAFLIFMDKRRRQERLFYGELFTQCAQQLETEPEDSAKRQAIEEGLAAHLYLLQMAKALEDKTANELKRAGIVILQGGPR